MRREREEGEEEERKKGSSTMSAVVEAESSRDNKSVAPLEGDGDGTASIADKLRFANNNAIVSSFGCKELEQVRCLLSKGAIGLQAEPRELRIFPSCKRVVFGSLLPFPRGNRSTTALR